MAEEKLITVAVYTYQKAQIIKSLLESEGIPVVIQNINLIQPIISSGVRVRIKETDLPHALTVLEDLDSVYPADGKAVKKNNKTVPRILIPVDFSDYSYKACLFGFDIAGKIGAKVTILHTYVLPYIPEAIPLTETLVSKEEISTIKKIRNTVAKRIKEFTAEIERGLSAGELSKVPYECLVKEGIPEDEIYQFCRRTPPSLVVMGTRGEGRKKTELIGSVTTEVIDSARVPVLAIPENTHVINYRQIRRVAFITNFDQKELLTIDTFIRLFGGFDFKIFFVHYISSERDIEGEIHMSALEKYFKKHYSDKECVCRLIKADNILTGVNDLVDQEKIDLISMTTWRRTIFARLFNPGIAHRMLFHSDTPILVLPGSR